MAAVDVSLLVARNEVLTSTELIDRLVGKGLRRDAARQVISRMPQRNGLWRSEKMRLPGGNRLYAQRQSVGSTGFLKKVGDIAQAGRPGIARLIHSMPVTQILLRPDAMRLLATPALGKSTARFRQYEQEVEALLEIGAAVNGQIGTPLEHLALPRLSPETTCHSRALRSYNDLILQGRIARILVDHFRNQGFLSWNGCELPDSPIGHAVFGGYPFSATGYSWLYPLLRWRRGSSKPKPTSVVADVYARSCTVHDVEGFVHRIDRCRHATPDKLPSLGIIASPVFDESAWRLAKQRGLLAVNLQHLMGEAAIAAMRQVRDLLAHVSDEGGTPREAEIQQLATVLDGLKNNPYVVAIRSIAMEMFAALILRTKGWEDVRMNELVPYRDGHREVDVHGHRDGGVEIRVVECKALGGRSDLDPADVRKFFTETVPAFLKHRYPSGVRKVYAELWTTGRVGDAAEAELRQTKLKANVEPLVLGIQALNNQMPNTLPQGARLLSSIAAV